MLFVKSPRSYSDFSRRASSRGSTPHPVWVSVSPLVVSRKPNGKIRLCVDLRGPNAQIVPEFHPLTTVKDLQTRLHGAFYS